MKNTVKMINFAVLEAGRTEDNREEYITAKRALREYIAEAVPAIEDAVSAAVIGNCTVRESVQRMIDDHGRTDALAVVAALVIRHADDGRIYPESVKWARCVPYAAELSIASGYMLYTNRIHKAHLQQVAQAMREWERVNPADAEPVKVEPVQVVEAAPVAADPVEVVTADAEPVKVARKARKPRKAAVVADEAAPVAAEPVEVVTADAEPVKVARKARKPRKAAVVADEAAPVAAQAVQVEPVQVIEAEPVRSVAAAAAVVPSVEVLSVPASVDPVGVGGWSFGASSVEVSGRALPVSYSVTKSGEVYAFTALDGVAVRLHIGKGDELYTAALAAARGEADVRKAARMEPVKVAPVAAQAVQVEPVQVVEAAPVAADPVAVVAEAEPVQADPVAVAEAAPVEAEPVTTAAPAAGADGKSWVGSSIVGDGWRIVFDAAEERTRVFCGAPTDAQRAAIEGAGFWWSPRMNSWNKKLTCKAYRAAVALAEVLRGIA